jgi:hypothetical protein
MSTRCLGIIELPFTNITITLEVIIGAWQRAYLHYVYLKKKKKKLWKRYSLFLGICNKKIVHFVNPLHNYKIVKVQHKWDVFSQHNPKRRSHKYVSWTSLMEHDQSFEALWIKCVWSFNFIFIATQMTQTQVKFINTLLLGTILMWFVFLLKCQSPFLNDFETFIE